MSNDGGTVMLKNNAHVNLSEEEFFFCLVFDVSSDVRGIRCGLAFWIVVIDIVCRRKILGREPLLRDLLLLLLLRLILLLLFYRWEPTDAYDEGPAD